MKPMHAGYVAVRCEQPWLRQAPMWFQSCKKNTACLCDQQQTASCSMQVSH
jgi:hypothetical protein